MLEPEPGRAHAGAGGAIMGDRLEPGRYTVNGGAPVEARNGQIEVRLEAGVSEIVIARLTPPK